MFDLVNYNNEIRKRKTYVYRLAVPWNVKWNLESAKESYNFSKAAPFSNIIYNIEIIDIIVHIIYIMIWVLLT